MWNGEKDEVLVLRTGYEPAEVREMYSDAFGFHVDPNSAEENRTHQEFKEECDINEIVRRFGLTGELPENVRVPVSGDFTGIGTYQEALNAVIAADKAFMELPPDVRLRFANDPQQLMDFVADDKNRDEAEKLGLLKPKVVVEKSTAQVLEEVKAMLTPKA